MSPTHRRMTVIVSLDVAGFTRMLRADESGTLRAMAWIRRELGEPLLARYRGRAIKIMGDGVLMEFESVHEAATWATEFQRAVALADKRNRVGQPIQSRIAIVLADLIIAGDERYGEGLNFGVRLQEIAPIGGVVVSEAVWFNLRADMRERFRDAGQFKVKNIDEPVRGFVWTPEGVSKTASAPASRPNLSIVKKGK
ncbi:MAG: adenylate/guanylate cyclase domain-containing protein [Beijerinckiaceae bacterium]